MKNRYLFLQVKDGNVKSINEAGNVGIPYYNGGDAVRAHWSDMGDGYVEIYKKDGTILVLNRGGNHYKIIR